MGDEFPFGSLRAELTRDIDMGRVWGLPLGVDIQGVYAELGQSIPDLADALLCGWDVDERQCQEIRASAARGGFAVPAFRTREIGRVVLLGVGELADLTPKDRRILAVADIKFSGKGDLAGDGKLYLPTMQTEWLSPPSAGRALVGVPYVMFAITLTIADNAAQQRGDVEQ